jgi:uncharacterized membrane protein YdcZ (DUF606 family)
MRCGSVELHRFFCYSGSMHATYFPILIIVAGGLIYQLSQKSLAKNINAYYVIIIAYLAGIVLCLLCNWSYPAEGSLTETFKKSNWAVYGIGVGAVLVEVGFLLAYRQGWHLSITSMLVNMIISLVLLPIGILIYKEKLSGWNMVGIAFYFVGLILISKRSE